ncbi:HAMP domain-containing histidine kinase [Patescibacteria group bacterium]|nr:HAMP domain-containing histidine kinase [Patescibacteria group bacterium]
MTVEGDAIQFRADRHTPNPLNTEGVIPAVLTTTPSPLEGYVNLESPVTEEPLDSDALVTLCVQNAGLKEQIAGLEAERAGHQTLITQLFVMIQALSEQTKGLNEMVRIVAHDLRSPTTAITGNIQIARKMLSKEPLNRDKLDKILETADTNTWRIANQINRTLDVEDPLERLQKRPRSIAAIIKEASENTAKSIKQAGVSLIIEPPDPALQVFANDTLTSVLMIFMENAAHAMTGTRKSTRVLSITSQIVAEGKNITLYAADNGIGISEKYQEKIFRGYSSKRSSSGFGLGEAQAIALKHGGRVWLERSVTKEMLQEDPSLGHTGSTFALSLPLC